MTGRWHITPLERLERKLVRRAGGCLEWTGCTAKGYGVIYWNGRQGYTHRLAWESAYGPIPAGLWVLHHCDTPLCCETTPSKEYPDGHLFLGDHDENMADMWAKGRGRTPMGLHEKAKTHCPQRHEYTPENTYVAPGAPTKRKCRICGGYRARSAS